MKKRKAKRLLSAVLLLGLLSVLFASATTAFNAQNGTARSVITSSGITIDLQEKMIDENGMIIDFNNSSLGKMVPGATFSKIVSVQNTGEAQAWIRVSVVLHVEGPDGNPLDPMLKQDAPIVYYNSMENWHDGGDGWFYYERPVSALMETDPLFEKMVIDPRVDNTYHGAKVHAVVTAQAVQTAHNGQNVWEAQGWPENA